MLVKLSDDLRQDEPVGWLVFCFNQTIEEYRLFASERDAVDFAREQENAARDLGEMSDWRVYSLYAGTPVEPRQRRKKGGA